MDEIAESFDGQMKLYILNMANNLYRNCLLFTIQECIDSDLLLASTAFYESYNRCVKNCFFSDVLGRINQPSMRIKLPMYGLFNYLIRTQDLFFPNVTHCEKSQLFNFSDQTEYEQQKTSLNTLKKMLLGFSDDDKKAFLKKMKEDKQVIAAKSDIMKTYSEYIGAFSGVAEFSSDPLANKFLSTCTLDSMYKNYRMYEYYGEVLLQLGIFEGKDKEKIERLVEISKNFSEKMKDHFKKVLVTKQSTALDFEDAVIVDVYGDKPSFLDCGLNAQQKHSRLKRVLGGITDAISNMSSLVNRRHARRGR